jgi:4-hydroxyproline epimerase
VGQDFVHESYIGSTFVGRIAGETNIGGRPAIIPTIQGSAYATGRNEIWIDDQEPFPDGFQVV